MSLHRVQDSLPEKFEVLYNFGSNRARYAKKFAKGFGIFLGLLGLTSFAIAYFFFSYGKDAQELKGLFVFAAVFFLFLGLLMYLMGTFGGKTLQAKIDNPFFLALTHEGLQFPDDAHISFLPWGKIISMRTQRPTTFNAYGALAFELQFTYDNGTGKQRIGLNLNGITLQDIKKIKRYAVAFMPSKSKIDFRNTKYWQNKYGYVS